MPNKLTERTLTTTVPTHMNVIEDGEVKRSVWSAFMAHFTALFPRSDEESELTAGQRTQLLNNIGNVMQIRLSDDAASLHIYTPGGVYKGSVTLLDLGQSNL